MKRQRKNLSSAELAKWLRPKLRRITRMWPARNAARLAARVERTLNPATGRMSWHSKCAACGRVVPDGDIQMDHIIPVGNMEADLGAAVERMFPPLDGWQALCEVCHAAKTKQEREQRTAARSALAKQRSSARTPKRNNARSAKRKMRRKVPVRGRSGGAGSCGLD